MDLQKNFEKYAELILKKGLNIKKGETRCISNIIIEKESEISIKSGSILCIIKEN